MKNLILCVLLVSGSANAGFIYCFNEVAESSEETIQKAIEQKLNLTADHGPTDVYVTSVTFKGNRTTSVENGAVESTYEVKGSFAEFTSSPETGAPPKSRYLFSSIIVMKTDDYRMDLCGDVKTTAIKRLVNNPVLR